MKSLLLVYSCVYCDMNDNMKNELLLVRYQVLKDVMTFKVGLDITLHKETLVVDGETDKSDLSIMEIPPLLNNEPPPTESKEVDCI